MAIERLSTIDAVTSATKLAANDNGIDRSVTIAVLTAYLNTVITKQGVKATQYNAPSATGFSVVITDSSTGVWLILTPISAYAAGTIVLPSLANSIDKQEVMVNCTQDVAALTVNGNGSTVTGAPASLAANDYFTLRFDGVTKTWYRVK